MRIAVRSAVIIFIWVLIEALFLAYYLRCYKVKGHMHIYAILAYIGFSGINIVLEVNCVGIWIRLLASIGMLIAIMSCMYDGISIYKASKEAIVFLLISGAVELIMNPIICWLMGHLHEEAALYESARPDIWIMSMGLARLGAIILFQLYRKLERRGCQRIYGREAAVLYAPLAVTFVCFLVVIRNIANLEYFGKGLFPFLAALLAGALLANTLVSVLLVEKYIVYRNQNRELQLRQKKEKIIEEYYRDKMESFENISIMYHDLKHHSMLMPDCGGRYQARAGEVIRQYENLFDTGNEALNVLLWEKKKEALRYGISFECHIRDVNLSFIDYMDICSIMGNLLDNAIEAGKEVRRVRQAAVGIKIAGVNELVIFKVENDCLGDSKVKLGDNTFATTKQEKKMHGIGLRSVLRAVRKYDGHCDFRVEGDKFITEILVPLPMKR